MEVGRDARRFRGSYRVALSADPRLSISGDLRRAEVAAKAVRSLKDQLAIAKLPLAKELPDFPFKGTPINAALVGDLAPGSFIAHQQQRAGRR